MFYLLNQYSILAFCRCNQYESGNKKGFFAEAFLKVF